MVKAGFIVEGASERIVVESQSFRTLLQSCGYELVTPVVDANGAGNLLPHNIEAFVDRLDEAGAQEIFILTNLEDEAHVQTVRDRVSHQRIRFAFVAVKALEAWFLADTQAMNAWLKTDDFLKKRRSKQQKNSGRESSRLLHSEEVLEGLAAKSLLPKRLSHTGDSASSTHRLTLPAPVHGS
ncbi:hypothetical protein [Pseudomonas asplenii]|uniref:hypothetical protein n=1 Tax=Pseudomonas asplenii TaxID=53407 RepID=UPI0006CC3E75|nr:hypothetical protein [Pseudomonas fuscovaginae]KPA97974.1 hypothetical protein PF70_01925 [Pseudomonas fuscovaginae]